MSKTENILEYLKKGNTITNVDAVDLFKAYRLSAIIYNLKKKGYNISTINEINEETKTRYARYKLIG